MKAKATMRCLSEKAALVKDNQYGNIGPAVTPEQKMFYFHFVNNAEGNAFL
ncbi:hypothetical protein [Erwinia persicina]|uniref:Uncharacterized protein n=1 Tax=Erwinia persicina TaxID=55211 RepID=A0ABR9A0D6_9GAMM|nr:hypothetical protein [Erwinia persicina]MBD8109444.1 hypothetical protein [Erwinia persicina]MBD8170354.1 hypothetical protein [Erwinia persicina]MBD8212589.1 hypothetical protein [Erwinia persicina]